jgi:hypothetical protein
MKKDKYIVTFNYKDEITVCASNEEEAEILAKAEMIRAGKDFRKITEIEKVD